jgi:NAD(P)-dependent dehydrogenase (short-subunit alcohol dehydrogenase family)
MKSLCRVAIVTGAGSGIGRATALALAADGYSVALAGRRAEPLQATADLIGAPERVLVVPTDVTQEDSVAALFAQTVQQWGHLDLLFNNAGTGAPAVPLDQLTLAQWQSVVDVNLTGMFLCLREAFRVMKAQTPQGGRIINNGSISAHTPRPHSVAYTSTKHGVMGLTKTASLDGREFNIAVGQIDIGNAGTEMTTRMAAGILQPNGSLMAEPLMDVNLVGESVVYMAGLPLSANVLFHTVMATSMPFVGRG